VPIFILRISPLVSAPCTELKVAFTAIREPEWVKGCIKLQNYITATIKFMLFDSFDEEKYRAQARTAVRLITSVYTRYGTK
jgi:hypothetical protein